MSIWFFKYNFFIILWPIDKQLALPSINDDKTSKSKKPKPNTKQSKKQLKGLEKPEVKWMETPEIHSILDKIVTSQEQVLPHIMRKWHPSNNALILNGEGSSPFIIKYKWVKIIVQKLIICREDFLSLN